ncbi:hypothetical protein [Rhizohabitans arisaemae]|uniref:hypothetical protein n=1 Tax=Rhizohabitans arisaemae TaxID=2720610 RepID=UPI0024B1B78C|nr:hypothetical protein [Rhizohabitans arisaemae]
MSDSELRSLIAERNALGRELAEFRSKVCLELGIVRRQEVRRQGEESGSHRLITLSLPPDQEILGLIRRLCELMEPSAEESESSCGRGHVIADVKDLSGNSP